MKTLAESLFDDNVTNDINVTSIRATEQLIIDGLEDTLKMKCMNIDTAPTSEQNAIWDIGRWTLAMYSADEYLSDTTNIYLQYNIDWSGLAKSNKETNNTTFTIKFIIRIGDWRDNQVALKEVGIEVFGKFFNFETGVNVLDFSIPYHTRLKDYIFNTNTQDIVKFIEECFSKFKKYVSMNKFDKVFYYLYSKQQSQGPAYRKDEQHATIELSKIFNTIVK